MKIVLAALLAPSPPPSPAPVATVTAGAGWLDYLQAFSGVVGIALAVLALWLTRRQAVQAKRDLIDERRVTFELEVLRDLLVMTDNALPPFDAVVARLAMLPDSALPFWRDWVRLRFTHVEGDPTLVDLVDAMNPPMDLHNHQLRMMWAMREDIRRAVEDRGHATSRQASPRRRVPQLATARAEPAAERPSGLFGSRRPGGPTQSGRLNI